MAPNLRAGWVPLFVRAGDDVPEGNRELIRRGGRAIRSEGLAASLDHIIGAPGLRPRLTLRRESPAPYAVDEDLQADLFPVVWPRLAEFLMVPRTETEVADALHLQKAQAKTWLQRAVDEGLVRKLSKPVRFERIHTATDPQASLFEC